MVNENIKMDWNQNMEEVALAFENSIKYHTDFKYIMINSNTKQVIITSDKKQALSFEKISNLVETILSKQDVAIETKKRILRNFIKIKKNFASKELDLFTYFFFGKRKDSQVKASARIIEQGVLQLGLKKELKEEFNIQASKILSAYEDSERRGYVGINSKEELYITTDKSKALSFEKLSYLVKEIFSDQNLSFSGEEAAKTFVRKQRALDGFEKIKNRFELKKLNWFVDMFFWKKKNTQVKAAETIIEERKKQLAQEKAKLLKRVDYLLKEIKKSLNKVKNENNEIDKTMYEKIRETVQKIQDKNNNEIQNKNNDDEINFRENISKFLKNVEELESIWDQLAKYFFRQEYDYGEETREAILNLKERDARVKCYALLKNNFSF